MQLLAFSYQLSAISLQLSAFSYQPSALDCYPFHSRLARGDSSPIVSLIAES
jgi:hypothetical protein